MAMTYLLRHNCSVLDEGEQLSTSGNRFLDYGGWDVAAWPQSSNIRRPTVSCSNKTCLCQRNSKLILCEYATYGNNSLMPRRII